MSNKYVDLDPDTAYIRHESELQNIENNNTEALRLLGSAYIGNQHVMLSRSVYEQIKELLA